MNNIRNFSIIAHINHGKSTLSDRIIQICGGLSDREMKAQVLDSMELERERGITIKAQSVTLNYKSLKNINYQLNFIDTPGHVDFSCEVSRSLAACEGALLVIDASKGIEAQTLANCYSAVEMNIKIIPVLNKIDLPNANSDRVLEEIKNIIGINTSEVIYCSAKTGSGVVNLLEQLINRIPPPQGNSESPLQALVIDSWFNNYLGVFYLIRIKNGTLCKGDKIKFMSTGKIYNVSCIGIFTPKQTIRNELKCGEVGWLTCSIKDIRSINIGDTLTKISNPTDKILPSFKKTKPQVYAGLFPVNSDDYEILNDALIKLSLNDSSIFYEQEQSPALGSGFRCGFLGLLHMDIIKERLKREYNLNIVTTIPTVVYEIETKNKKIIYIDNPSKLPSLNNIRELREPIAECNIIVPRKYLGNIIKLCTERRGIQINIIYCNEQVSLTYEIPMIELILNFFDYLKSSSKGYASLNYAFKKYKPSDIVRLDFVINGERIDALSIIIHKSNALYHGKSFVKKIKDIISRQQFNMKIQAMIGKHVIASSSLKQLRKNVLDKCNGGDVNRKKKLLYKQKEGKKRMKKFGRIKIPKDNLISILDLDKHN